MLLAVRQPRQHRGVVQKDLVGLLVLDIPADVLVRHHGSAEVLAEAGRGIGADLRGRKRFY